MTKCECCSNCGQLLCKPNCVEITSTSFWSTFDCITLQGTVLHYTIFWSTTTLYLECLAICFDPKLVPPNAYLKISATLASNYVNWVYDFLILSSFLLSPHFLSLPLSISQFPRDPISRPPQVVLVCISYICSAFNCAGLRLSLIALIHCPACDFLFQPDLDLTYLKVSLYHHHLF